jgi:hypothetical protein
MNKKLIAYQRRLARLDAELAKHKRRTYATMGLWSPVWAFHAFRLSSHRSTAKHVIEALERAESLRGLV